MNRSPLGNRPIAVTLAVIGLLGYVITHHRARPGGESVAAAESGKNGLHAPQVVFTKPRLDSTNATDRVLNLDPSAILASVNGHALTARDVLPPVSSNQPVSMQVCEYFLQRAINRELIFQAAKIQGVELNESQKQQILNFKSMRAQPGPGTIRDVNGSSAEIAFESQDAEAFMLQTSLMNRAGTSPDVTSEQVQAYYQKHATDFAELPANTQARRDAWNAIDYQIRQLLAPSIRSDFQIRLIDYMNQLKAKANVQFTPLSSFATAQ